MFILWVADHTRNDHIIMRMTEKLRFSLLVAIITAVAFEATCAPRIDNTLVPNLDKIIHFGVFGSITWLLVNALDVELRSKYNSFMVAALSLIIIALLNVGDEYLQSFNATRHAELSDVIADLAGVFVVLVIWVVYKQHKTVLSENKGAVIS